MTVLSSDIVSSPWRRNKTIAHYENQKQKLVYPVLGQNIFTNNAVSLACMGRWDSTTKSSKQFNGTKVTKMTKTHSSLTAVTMISYDICRICLQFTTLQRITVTVFLVLRRTQKLDRLTPSYRQCHVQRRRGDASSQSSRSLTGRGQFQQLSSLPDRFLLLAAVRQRPLCMTASLLRIQHWAMSTVILSLPHTMSVCRGTLLAMRGVSELFIVDGYQEFASSRRTTECIYSHRICSNLTGDLGSKWGGVRTPPNPRVASPLPYPPTY